MLSVPEVKLLKNLGDKQVNVESAHNLLRRLMQGIQLDAAGGVAYFDGKRARRITFADFGAFGVCRVVAPVENGSEYIQDRLPLRSTEETYRFPVTETMTKAPMDLVVPMRPIWGLAVTDRSTRFTRYAMSAGVEDAHRLSGVTDTIEVLSTPDRPCVSFSDGLYEVNPRDTDILSATFPDGIRREDDATVFRFIEETAEQDIFEATRRAGMVALMLQTA